MKNIRTYALILALSATAIGQKIPPRCQITTPPDPLCCPPNLPDCGIDRHAQKPHNARRSQHMFGVLVLEPNDADQAKDQRWYNFPATPLLVDLTPKGR